MVRAQLALESSRRLPISRISNHTRIRCIHTDTSSNATNPSAGTAKSKAPSRQIGDDRDLFIDVLGATATKREAKSYLSRFRPETPKENSKTSVQKPATTKRQDSGVNLGGLFLPIISVDESPVFSQRATERPFTDPTTRPLRTALVVLRASEPDIEDQTLKDVSRTLVQLSRLGLSCVVVVESISTNRSQYDESQFRLAAIQDAERVVDAIEESKGGNSRRLDGILNLNMLDKSIKSTVKVHGKATVVSRDLLLKPLYRGVIPVIAPLAFDNNLQKTVPIETKDVALALARDLSGLNQGSGPHDDWNLSDETQSKSISLDRIIILDPHGGIPSSSRLNGSHVFINLEQEYSGVQEELESMKSCIDCATTIERHAANLELSRDMLRLLPPSSSAFITTPSAASATSSKPTTPSSGAPGVGTRPQRNPLIHNLLTDKPIFSSSLPVSRLSSSPGNLSISAIEPQPPTFLKHGLPVTIFPDPDIQCWRPPSSTSPPFSLSDSRLDLPRLIHLIEDSFGRKLDAKAYFERIAPRLAGIIVAGAYEGGAILTWETPPGLESSDSSSNELCTETHRMVPYLDKFAVLQRAQGAGGVADVLFNAMVRNCFPRGVVWRSRTENPVNKWYFERARGSYKVPSDQGKQGWTMFWTTPGVEGQRFEDYEGVCRSIGTTWADGKARLD